MEYRKEIDGLRALAVLPVLLFHAGFEFFSGGFVGVDVFFVISGYLITTIIISELANNKFSIVSFYERRARRILPALFFVMLVTIPFAWIILTPSDLKDFGQSLFAVSIFSSNISFWIESDYFDTAAELKPLLHTWSLAVEEQFYILFPLFLVLLWRFGTRFLLIGMLVIFFISLFTAHWSSVYSLNTKMITGSFFLLHTRAWELLIGSFCAFYLAYFKPPSEKSLNQFLSVIGFFMIVYSIIIFNKNTPFPSTYALIPTIGTALLILFAQPGSYLNKFLGFKYFVGIGLISYSVYLWHQPILAFARNISNGELSSSILISLLFTSILLGWFSWKFVEKPFRDKNRISRVNVFAFSLFGLIMFAIIGLQLHFNNGYPDRLTENDKRIALFYQKDIQLDHRGGGCFLKANNISSERPARCYEGDNVIWGDSHAGALSFGLSKFEDFARLTTSGCPPIIDTFFFSRPDCEEVNRDIINHIHDRKYDHIYLHANWLEYDLKKIRNIDLTIKELIKKNPEIDVTIIGGVPHWNPNLPSIIIKSHLKESSSSAYLEKLFNHDVDKIKNRDKLLIQYTNPYKNISYISLINKLCENNNCLATIRYCNEREPFAWNYGHLGVGGSLFTSQIILNKSLNYNFEICY